MANYKKIIILFILGIVAIVLFFLFESHGQRFIGSFYDFLNPNRFESLEEKYFKVNDRKLIGLLHHGDTTKASVAATLLSRRAKKELFNPISILLFDKSEDVRRSVRRILIRTDRKKAASLLIDSLKEYDNTPWDYGDTISLLAHIQYEPVYPYLVDYALKGSEYNFGTATYFKELGNPDAISVLREISNKKKNLTADTTKKITETIAYLESLQ